MDVDVMSVAEVETTALAEDYFPRMYVHDGRWKVVVTTRHDENQEKLLAMGTIKYVGITWDQSGTGYPSKF